MKRGTPVLTITLQIPLDQGASVEEVLAAIGQTVYEALEKIGATRDAEEPEEADGPESPSAASREAGEDYTEDTRDDLLSALGYTREE